jgi:hypothetical protein
MPRSRVSILVQTIENIVESGNGRDRDRDREKRKQYPRMLMRSWYALESETDEEQTCECCNKYVRDM